MNSQVGSFARVKVDREPIGRDEILRLEFIVGD